MTIPPLGLGLYKVPADDVECVVRDAVELGYPLVDSAEFYGTEAETARALRDAPDVLVQTKFWGDPQGYDEALRAFDRSAAIFGEGRIDTYMIHWPRPSRDQYVDTWRAFIRLRDEGRVRMIGVSNFGIDELERLDRETGVRPVLNQVELQPWLPQTELRAYDDAHGIVTQAWSPLARGRLQDDPVLASIARRRGATVAQVILAWHRALGHSAVVKSTHRDRLRENLESLAVDLQPEDLAEIATLETGQRSGTNPADRQ